MYYKGQRLRNRVTGDHVTVAAVIRLETADGKSKAYRLTDTGNGSLSEVQVRERYDKIAEHEPA